MNKINLMENMHNELADDSGIHKADPFISVELLNQFKSEMISHGYGSSYCFDTFDNGNLKSQITKTLFVGWRVANAERLKVQSKTHLISGSTEQVVDNISEKIIMDIFNTMKSINQPEAEIFLNLMTIRMCRNVMDEINIEAFVKLWNVIDDSFQEVIRLDDIKSGKRKSDA